MAKERDEIAEIIPENEYIPELEKEVEYYYSIAMKPSFVSKKIYTPIKIPEKFNSKNEQREFWFQELERIKNGYDGLSGKGYGWINYAKIKDPERGRISPEFRVRQEEYFRKVEDLQANPGRGLVGWKRRRFGFSWIAAWDIFHDCLTQEFRNIGMNSKSETDSRRLFNFVKFLHQSMPQAIRPLASVSDRRDYMEFAYWWDTEKQKVVAQKGLNTEKRGSQSSIVSTSPVPQSHEGAAYSKLLIDEAGKQPDLLELWGYAEDCLRLNTRRVSPAIIMGTVGDITKDGRGLMELYLNNEAYDLDRFCVCGYHGLIIDKYGNDLIKDAIRWIIYQRYKLRSAKRSYLETFKQKYPLDDRDAFNQVSDGGVGNIHLINDQIIKLSANQPEVRTGWMRPTPEGGVDFVPNPEGKIIVYELPDHKRINGYVAGCLPPGEKVLTDEGLKNIEDVKLENKLVSKDGDYVPIKELQRYEVDDDLYEIQVKNTFRTTKFTSEHPLYISKNKKGYVSYARKKRETGLKYSYQKFDFDFQTVDKVEVGDWIKYPNTYKKTIEYDLDSIWRASARDDKYQWSNIVCPLYSEDFWWFVGLFLGDGWVTGNHITISVNNKETSTLERLTTIITRDLARSPHIRNHGSHLEVDFNSTHLSSFLDANFGKYAAGKLIPEWVKYLDHKYKLALIGGYIDSDGCVGKSNRKGYGIDIVSINLGLMEALQDILFSVGIISSTSKLRDAKTTTIRGREVNQASAYRVRIGNYWTKRLQEVGCPSIKLQDIKDIPETRSQNMGCFFSDDLEYIYFQIINIGVSRFSGTVYNFHCETSTYLCRHITTHNCDPSDHDQKKKKAGNDVSDLALAIVSKPFGLEAPRLVLEYVDRPEMLDQFFEQAAMALKWYNNTQVLVEDNRARMVNYFKTNYPALLPLVPSSILTAKQAVEMKRSITMTEGRKQQIMGLIEDNIDHYSAFIPSIKLLEQFKVFGDPHADDDLAMAYGLALVMLQADKKVVKIGEEKEQQVSHLERVGNRIVRVTPQVYNPRNIPKTPFSR